jgi:hypothetical protein
MSNIIYRILNPALTPPQVVFENNDEQAALRDYAARHDAHTQGLIITKSEDGGTSWTGVTVRPPDVAVPLAAQAAAAAAPSHASHGGPPTAAPPIAPSVGSVTAGQAAAATGSPPPFTPSTATPPVTPVTPPLVSPTGRLDVETDHADHRSSTKHRK